MVVVVEVDDADANGLASVSSDDSAAAAALTFPERLWLEFVCVRVERDEWLTITLFVNTLGEEKRVDDEGEEGDDDKADMTTIVPPLTPPRLPTPAVSFRCCCCCCSTRGDTEAAHGERAARAAALILVRVKREDEWKVKRKSQEVLSVCVFRGSW